MNLHSLSDVELWALIASDNYRAFIVLFDRYWARLYKTSKKYIDDKEVCEEIVHDLFLTLWDKRRQLDIQHFENYVTVAARNSVYARLQKMKRQPVVYTEEVDFGSNVYDINEGLDKIIYSELEQQLENQLDALPRRCKEIFLLSRRNHLSNAEIAEQLNISKRTVENQITIALKHLRDYMNNDNEQSDNAYTLHAEKTPGIVRALRTGLKMFWGLW